VSTTTRDSRDAGQSPAKRADREGDAFSTLDRLRKNDEVFRSVFERGLIGMAISSRDMRWLEVNPRLCRMLGYSRDELLQRTWSDDTHPDDLDGNLELLERMLAGEIDEYTLEKRFIRKDGETVYAVLYVTCLRGDDGSVQFVVSHIHDVTDRKRAEAALRESEEQYRTLFETALVGLFRARITDGIIDKINEAGARLGASRARKRCWRPGSVRTTIFRRSSGPDSFESWSTRDA